MVVQAVALVAPAAEQRQQETETPRLYRQAKAITAVIMAEILLLRFLLAAVVVLALLVVTELHLLLEAVAQARPRQSLAVA
jgi:hypothetical protein